jgi:hypothetical protein
MGVTLGFLSNLVIRLATYRRDWCNGSHLMEPAELFDKTAAGFTILGACLGFLRGFMHIRNPKEHIITFKKGEHTTVFHFPRISQMLDKLPS